MEGNGKSINIPVADRFLDFIQDWNYATYLLLGGYGSGKSYDIALKIVLKCLEEKRKVLVARDVYATMRESCYALFREVLENMELLEEEESIYRYVNNPNKVTCIVSPMQIRFPNGSKIIFKGLDSTEKIKSLQGVSIVWIEECSEINFAAYKELLGRIRTMSSMHFFLSCNPVGKENWVYTHFFKSIDDEGNEHVILDDEKLYEKRTLIKNGVYYHHSLPDENPFLPPVYIKRLEEMKTYDPYLHNVAKNGRFGTTGTRVLPQFEVAKDAKEFVKIVRSIPGEQKFIGLDFGFEESFNALVRVAVDMQNKILYIYDEIYINHVTDDKFANLPEMQEIRDNDELITADAAEPKTIKYYKQLGYRMRACYKFAGSRLANTRKIKRFKKIVCSPKCKNTIRELRDLTYKKDKKGNVIYDEFNIDPHTFSAIWYALDRVTVADIKQRKFNSQHGNRR